MTRARHATVAGTCFIAAATLLACGGPEASQSGQCGLSGLAQPAASTVQRLSKSQCGMLPLQHCDSIPGVSCIRYESPGQYYNYAAMLIDNADAWQKLSSGWSGAAYCVPNPPTDWADATLVLVRLSASSTTRAKISYGELVSPAGVTHLDFQLEVGHCGDCDCAAHDSVALLVRTPKRPTVCLDARPTGC